MIRQSTLQDLALENLELGRTYTLVVTAASPTALELQFKHAGDTTYRVHPGITGTSANIIFNTFVAFTTDMRIHFTSQPTQYYMSCIAQAVGSF